MVATNEAIGFVATTEGIKGEDIHDLMVMAVERRFGAVNRLPATIEWPTDNGSCYIANETERFSREIGSNPDYTGAEPQSNGMAEAFMRTIKRVHAWVASLPDAETAMQQLPKCFEHYNTVYPHRALRYRSQREFIASRLSQENVSGF